MDTSHQMLTGTVTGWLSNGRMRPPQSRRQWKAYYREAVRITRAPGRRRRKFRRMMCGIFRRYGGMMGGAAAQFPDAPYVVELASGAKVSGKGFAVAFGTREAVLTPAGPVTETQPVT